MNKSRCTGFFCSSCMQTRLILITLLIGAGLIVSVVGEWFDAGSARSAENKKESNKAMAFEIEKSEQEWKKELTPEEYRVLREKGTEPAFTGKYYKNEETGIYHCAACGNPLFRSEDKYHSGSGWPSYVKPISEDSVRLHEDRSHGMVRTEALCGRCGSHLGHVFNDGPQPTGKRYCINSVALDFEKKE